MAGIPLSQVLSELRSEMEAARAEGEGKFFRFNVEEVNIELQVAMTFEGKGGGSVKFWVLEANAGGSASKQNIQTINVKLKPFTSDGTSPYTFVHNFASGDVSPTPPSAPSGMPAGDAMPGDAMSGGMIGGVAIRPAIVEPPTGPMAISTVKYPGIEVQIRPTLPGSDWKK